MRELHALPLGLDNGEEPVRLTEAQIQEAEDRLGSQLPEDYREFVRDFGAFSVDALFPVREGDRSQAGIGYFYGIMIANRRKSFDFVTHYLERDPQLVPDDAIIVGYSGNVPILLYFKGSKKGKIYIRDYEELCSVADSFTEFMQLLKNEFNDMENEGIVEDAAQFWNSFST
ncbi:hypothetical protein IAD21_03801 [Abditibacteriota bacterium]|nr:hypothetical protein IAD21_03801 [Abditibacteriota bacterium]